MAMADVHINAFGYLCISTTLFVVWLAAFVFFDRLVYVTFSRGQFRMHLAVGTSLAVIVPTSAAADQLRRRGNAPLPLRASSKSVASVPSLSPVTLSAPEHLTSELLRTLSRVAASKPTSWLSRHSDIVSHLANTWGP